MTMIDTHPLSGEFPLTKDILYLNHAGVGPIPQRSVRVMTDLAQHMATRGAFPYAPLMAAWEQARKRCARLLNADSEAICFIPNTSQGLSYVALGVDWQPGDNIVTSDQEFPSNLLVWMDTARRFGVTLRHVPSLPDGSVDARALLSQVDRRTRVVTVSSVQYATGAAVDLSVLGQALAKEETLLVVDAIQSLGVLPLDAPALGVDVVAADGHKWLLSPEGCGMQYFSQKALAQISPRILGWHSVANAGQYDRVVNDLRPGARRFEAGSPNVLGAAALGEAVALLEEAGMTQVTARVRGLAGELVRGLLSLGCDIHSPLAQDGLPQAGIVTFSQPGKSAQELHRHLVAQGIFCAPRGKGVRFSPHFYLDSTAIGRALTALE